MRKLIAIGATAALLVLGAGACSDDSDDASDTDTTEATAPATEDDGTTSGSTPVDPELAAYCQAVGEAGGDDPDFNGFFEEHPEPTLEDWAEFLPGVIEGMDATLTELEAITPPDTVAELHQDAIDALTALRDLFQESLDAAEAGDQTTFDSLEDQNQGELSPALEEAIAAVTDACGAEG